MIGSGIFFGLSIMAQWVQTPGLLIGLWVFGGLFTMLGAISCAELAAMYPHAGGQYVFLREAYGDFWAFLFGWTQFLVIQTGFNAAVAIAFAKYLGVLVPRLGEDNVLARFPLGELLPLAAQAHLPHCLLHLELNSAQLVACGVIALLTAVNIRGVREGAFVQNLFTVLKVLALVALIAAGLSRAGGASHFFPLVDADPRHIGRRDGLSGRAGRRPVEGPLRLRRLVHRHLRGRGGPRFPSHAPPGAVAGLPAGDGPVRAHERRLPARPARRPDRRGRRRTAWRRAWPWCSSATSARRW